MGYMSDVAYTIKFKDRQTLNEFVALVMLKGGADVEALSACAVNWDYCDIRFRATDVKWYDSFEDVQAHHALMEFAVERFENDAAYQFIRIGEELDDIEEQSREGSNVPFRIDDHMYVRRTLENAIEPNYEPIGDALAVQTESVST